MHRRWGGRHYKGGKQLKEKSMGRINQKDQGGLAMQQCASHGLASVFLPKRNGED